MFYDDLSIDESMLPYYGKHSAKMFIRMKPIRFGYKLWVLAGYDGYPYSMSIYSGKTAEKPIRPLGFRVVDDLLKSVTEKSIPNPHTTYFDNFFTSHALLVHLKNEGF